MSKPQRRQLTLLILTTAYAFSFLDRNVLGLLIQPIKVDLKLSDTEIGLLTGIAFAFFYSTLGIPIARWADTGNRKTIITAAVAIWSLAVTLCGIVSSFPQLLVARIAASVGEAGCVPPSQSLLADYFERAELSRAMSLYMLGGPISVIIGFVLAGWINELYNWRLAFFAVGLPGFALAFIVWTFLREPRKNVRRLTAAELVASAAAESRAPTYITVFSSLWRQKSYRHLVIGFTLIYLFSFGIAQWVPPFIMRNFHIGTGALGTWYALIWGVGGLLGTYAGGYFAARYASHNEERQLNFMAVCLVGFVPLYLGLYLTRNLYVLFALMTVGAMVFSSIFGPLYAIVQDVVPERTRAMSVAIVLLFSNLIGMGLGPIVVGAMSDYLAPKFGSESLRLALVVWTPGYLWAAYHLYRAAQTVRDDISYSNSTRSLSHEEVDLALVNDRIAPIL